MAQQSTKTFNFQSKILWALALTLIFLAVWGNSFYSYVGLLYRVIGVLLILSASLVILRFTEFGNQAFNLITQSFVEVRKVVWPNRTETTQTTFIVAAAVIAASLILWGLDSLFSLAMKAIIG
ncbi:preprotein translocase subunit SecE [SAR86 cluster bacterium]|jgi:preprotein translocase subunit SecE|nr:preprotein translocase subunit SecE [SAR86 cluster bacterium]